MNKQSYHYKPLGWGGKFYGVFFILTGIVLSYSFVHEVMHRQANLGGSPFFQSAFSVVLWVGFAIVALAITVCGLLLFFAERTVQVTGDTITVRDFKGLRTRRYNNANIRYIVVKPQILFAVFNAGSGGAVRTTAVGKNYAVVLRPLDSRKTITLCVNRDSKISRQIVAQLLTQFKTQLQCTELYLDTLGSTKGLTPLAGELWGLLQEHWEETYGYLRPFSQHSYTESNEAFPLSGNLSVDLDQCADELGWSWSMLKHHLQALRRSGLVK